MKAQKNIPFIILSVLFLILVTFSSCSSTNRACDAYGFNDVK